MKMVDYTAQQLKTGFFWDNWFGTRPKEQEQLYTIDSIETVDKFDPELFFDESMPTFEEGTGSDEQLKSLLVERCANTRFNKMFRFTGKMMNDYYHLFGDNAYPDNHIMYTADFDEKTDYPEKSEIPSMRWFDDVVCNNYRREMNNFHDQIFIYAEENGIDLLVKKQEQERYGQVIILVEAIKIGEEIFECDPVFPSEGDTSWPTGIKIIGKKDQYLIKDISFVDEVLQKFFDNEILVD